MGASRAARDAGYTPNPTPMAIAMSGGVLAWSPTAGLELLPDGWTVDAGLYFGTGQRCVAGGVDIINYDTNFDAANNPISAVISVDHDV